jgi:hypothetical protein
MALTLGPRHQPWAIMSCGDSGTEPCSPLLRDRSGRSASRPLWLRPRHRRSHRQPCHDIVVTPGVPITFETDEVPDEARDDGNLTAPSKSPSSTTTSGTTTPSLSPRPATRPSNCHSAARAQMPCLRPSTALAVLGPRPDAIYCGAESARGDTEIGQRRLGPSCVVVTPGWPFRRPRGTRGETA